MKKLDDVEKEIRLMGKMLAQWEQLSDASKDYLLERFTISRLPRIQSTKEAM